MLKLTSCGCGRAYYERMPRSWWMRMLWTRRLYRCERCGAQLLLPTWR